MSSEDMSDSSRKLFFEFVKSKKDETLDRSLKEQALQFAQVLNLLQLRFDFLNVNIMFKQKVAFSNHI